MRAAPRRGKACGLENCARMETRPDGTTSYSIFKQAFALRGSFPTIVGQWRRKKVRQVQEPKRPKNSCLGVLVDPPFTTSGVGGRASQPSCPARQSLKAAASRWDLDCRLLSITPPMIHHSTRMPLALAELFPHIKSMKERLRALKCRPLARKLLMQEE